MLLPPEEAAPATGRRLIYDLESDGLLRELTRIHVLAIRDIDSRETFRFRHNDVENNILDGIAMLNEATLIVGHNIIGFDNYALWKVYGDAYAPTGTMRDTLIMARVMFSDEKDRDFRRWKRGDLDGKLIGSHTLEAWGMRLGFPKDEYSARMKERCAGWWAEDIARFAAMEEWDRNAAIDAGDIPLAHQFKDLKAYTSWATWVDWSQEMEDYGCQDLDPTEALWRKIEGVDWNEESIILEHMICDLMARVEQNGFYFDRDQARVLEGLLRVEHDGKASVAHEHFGEWLTAAKWRRDQAPREEFGEDESRKMWAEVTVPKRSIKYKDPGAKGGDRTEGCPYCPIVLKDFNPNSRPMIIDRLKTIYEWEPQEFTEKNNPVVNDEVLRDLGHTIPICTELAEIFYYKKRLGQLADGAESWLGNCQPDGRIHPRINPGGTITNRASHSKPNIAQVPRVVFKKLLQWMEDGVVARQGIDGKFIYGIPGVDPDGAPTFDQNLTPMLDPDGVQFQGIPVKNKVTGEYDRDSEGKIKTKASLMKGRAGDHGWDCRRLFVAPPGWVLMGADQQGIELRALAHAMWEFDDGAYAKILLEGDIHDAHTAAMELDSRDKAKTFIYALLYGAADFKLGTVIDPTLANNPNAAQALGAKMRDRLMHRFPALKLLTKAVQKSARQGYVMALDGRKLFTRSKHAALNTLLQGMGATLAKVWAVSFESFMEDEGFVHGWNGDFVIVAWVHDELQVCVRDDPRVMEAVERLVIEAAKYAGERVGFKLPVELGTPKFGRNWSDTH